MQEYDHPPFHVLRKIPGLFTFDLQVDIIKPEACKTVLVAVLFPIKYGIIYLLSKEAEKDFIMDTMITPAFSQPAA